MVLVSRRALFLALSNGTGLLRAAMRSFLLMRCMRMVVVPEVLGLLRGAFTISRHEFSLQNVKKGYTACPQRH
jgi:hypothetical protein